MIVVYFDNCYASCKEGIIELPDGAGMSAMIDAARAKWGEGVMRRAGNEYMWCKNSDCDADWRGCCAMKLGLAQRGGEGGGGR